MYKKKITKKNKYEYLNWIIYNYGIVLSLHESVLINY